MRYTVEVSCQIDMTFTAVVEAGSERQANMLAVAEAEKLYVPAKAEWNGKEVKLCASGDGLVWEPNIADMYCMSCELPGPLTSGFPGILVNKNNMEVYRCDACGRYASDEQAAEVLKAKSST